MSDGVQFAINIPINQDLDDDDDELLHEPPTYDAQPAKSVLKKDGTSSRKQQSVPIVIPTEGKIAKKKNSSNSKKELKWDEQVIEEHDLLRGTRMKVMACVNTA